MIEKRMAVSVDHAMEFLAPVPEFHNHKDLPTGGSLQCGNVQISTNNTQTNDTHSHTPSHLPKTKYPPSGPYARKERYSSRRVNIVDPSTAAFVNNFLSSETTIVLATGWPYSLQSWNYRPINTILHSLCRCHIIWDQGCLALASIPTSNMGSQPQKHLPRYLSLGYCLRLSR